MDYLYKLKEYSQKMSFKESAHLKLDLLINGIRPDISLKDVPEELYKEYRANLFYNHRENITVYIPGEVILPHYLATDFRINSNSPYCLHYKEGEFLIYKNDEEVTKVIITPRPEFYGKKTSSGKRMSEVANILGLDLLAYVLFRECDFWKDGKQCHFCNIGYVNRNFPKPDPTPKEMAETFKEAIKDKRVKIEHVCFTTGTKRNGDLEAKKLIEVLEKINEYIPEDWKKIYGAALLSPLENTEYIERLADLRLECLGLAREIGNEERFKKLCPGKSQLEKRFYESLKKGIEVFGRGHVGVAFVSSLEPLEETIKKCEEYASMGAVPSVSVFHPGKGSKLANKSAWDKDYHLELYKSLGELYHKYDLAKNKFERPLICERCFKSSLSNEAYLGAFE